MLTRLRIKNFKRFPDADIELGQAVVFIGQNNSGKVPARRAGKSRFVEAARDIHDVTGIDRRRLHPNQNFSFGWLRYRYFFYSQHRRRSKLGETQSLH